MSRRNQNRKESFEVGLSDGDSMCLSGVENDIVSGMKLKNKILRDQQATDNEGILSVYESATDNDLMALFGMKKDG